MSQENVEIVQRMYEAFYRGDAKGALAYFDPEVEVDASRRADGGTGHGREELTAMIARWLGAWDEWSEEIEEMRDLGSQVFVTARQRGRGKGSGVDVENRYALIYELHGALITRMTSYAEYAEALEVAGLSE
jgi:ketosteroid isomerase-like protein